MGFYRRLPWMSFIVILKKLVMPASILIVAAAASVPIGNSAAGESVEVVKQLIALISPGYTVTL